ncbi:hypothetical protein D4764_13G0007040 [Takifugu flavidus]|uniref:Uncharacterized protein n=1 Tax=Takifugu flavidus TaxID=433684 RepID=A0A5C6P8L1_9TELE|nr:hypothetical protein D4764_13G0007040 [Takifugu flavidus]
MWQGVACPPHRLSGLFDQLNLSQNERAVWQRQEGRCFLPPSFRPERFALINGTGAVLAAVGCRLVSVGRVAPAGSPHGVDHLAYWTHCCFGSVPSLLFALAPLRSGDGAEA